MKKIIYLFYALFFSINAKAQSVENLQKIENYLNSFVTVNKYLLSHLNKTIDI